MHIRNLLGTKLNIESAPGRAFNLDTILLSDFVKINKGSKLIIDIGTGNGAIMLYLSQKFDGLITGIEIQESRYKQAIKNIELNNLSKRLSVVNIDAKNYLSEKKADVIVSNPPFFKVNEETKRSMDDDMLIAKHEVMINLDELISSVRRNLKVGGQFFLIHKADRLDEIMHLLNKYELVVKRLRFVHPHITSKANQVLIETRFKGSSHLLIEPPLIQYANKLEYSEEMNAIYEGREYK